MKINNHIRSINKYIIAVIFCCIHFISLSQILTTSPYSRYGLGDLNLTTFAPSTAMGGSFIAHQQDTIAPFFINIANPASLSGIRLSTFELGGQAQFSTISNSNTSIKTKTSNFSYAAVGFPLKNFGGAAFGIMPYTSVGYNIATSEENTPTGTMTYKFNGNGGINKAFIGTGIKPFKSQYYKFMRSASRDTLMKNHAYAKIKKVKVVKQLLSEFALGASANYLFGNINQKTDVIYPGSTYFNVKRNRSVQVSDFAFNFGLQTNFTIDSMKYHGKDTILKGKKVEFKNKLKIGFGFYANTPKALNAKQSNVLYNYTLNSLGNEITAYNDTILNSQDVSGKIKLPLELGFGLSLKKGESLTLLADYATTNWSGYKYFDTPTANFKNSTRVSVGLSYLPNKLAFGKSNYYKRIMYRCGASYNDGYLDIKNTALTCYALTAGFGLPVGIGRFDDLAVVNLSVQYGKMGSLSNNLLKEDYWRFVLGFTFNKRWFIKYKYD